jgi:hypothetical protein
MQGIQNQEMNIKLEGFPIYTVISAVQGTNRKPYGFFRENPLASFIDD